MLCLRRGYIVAAAAAAACVVVQLLLCLLRIKPPAPLPPNLPQERHLGRQWRLRWLGGACKCAHGVQRLLAAQLGLAAARLENGVLELAARHIEAQHTAWRDGLAS